MGESGHLRAAPREWQRENSASSTVSANMKSLGTCDSIPGAPTRKPLYGRLALESTASSTGAALTGPRVAAPPSDRQFRRRLAARGCRRRWSRGRWGGRPSWWRRGRGRNRCCSCRDRTSARFAPPDGHRRDRRSSYRGRRRSCKGLPSRRRRGRGSRRPVDGARRGGRQPH